LKQRQYASMRAQKHYPEMRKGNS